MNQLGSVSNVALVASLLLLVSMLWIRRRQGRVLRPPGHEPLDTVRAWPAQVMPTMTPLQLRAYELLRQALPSTLVLVHTPLAQFMRVSTRNSYAEWYRRAGRLRASLLVCDRHSNVIAAVDLRPSGETERERARHVRVVRVLESVGVTVLTWTEGQLPSASQVRHGLGVLLEEQSVSETRSDPNPGLHMSGASEALSVESTDFAGLDTAPAPLHVRGRTSQVDGQPVHQ